MSRVIKFRCWNAFASHMHDWSEMVEKNKIHLLSNENKSYVCEQFSGFVDKSGIDAYEGDIIKITRNNPSWVNELVNLGVVEFTDCSFIVEFDGKKLNLSNSYWGTEMQVIGNIHQNPELMK